MYFLKKNGLKLSPWSQMFIITIIIFIPITQQRELDRLSENQPTAGLSRLNEYSNEYKNIGDWNFINATLIVMQNIYSGHSALIKGIGWKQMRNVLIFWVAAAATIHGITNTCLLHLIKSILSEFRICLIFKRFDHYRISIWGTWHVFSSFDRPQTELYRCYRYYYLLPLLYVASSVGGKSRDLRNTLGETHYMLSILSEGQLNHNPIRGGFFESLKHAKISYKNIEFKNLF